ncbi:hypothetical protein ACFL54_03860 [Planctomycetota bacterium]
MFSGCIHARHEYFEQNGRFHLKLFDNLLILTGFMEGRMMFLTAINDKIAE